MNIKYPWIPMILRMPEGADAGAGSPPDGDPPTGAGSPPDGDPPTGAGSPPDGDPPASGKWWEGEGLSDEQRQLLVTKGLTVDDPVEAIARLTDMERAAQQKLGKSADMLMEKPGEGQSAADWLRAHGDMFGVPEKPDGYEVARPEGWPKDAPWNTDLEEKARDLGHQHGLSGDGLNAMVGLYAQEIQRLETQSVEDLAAASQAMQGELQRDWGDQYAAKVALAQQAASVVAEAAGLDSDALENLAATLKPKVGDAGTIRLFAAIGEMAGDDTVLGMGNGGNVLGTTPAMARAELAKQQAPGGEWYEAVEKRNQGEISRLKPRMDQLNKLASG